MQIHKDRYYYLILSQACTDILVTFIHLMCEIHMMRVLPWMVVLEETWETLLASYVMQAFISSYLFLFFYP